MNNRDLAKYKRQGILGVHYFLSYINEEFSVKQDEEFLVNLFIIYMAGCNTLEWREYECIDQRYVLPQVFNEFLMYIAKLPNASDYKAINKKALLKWWTLLKPVYKEIRTILEPDYEL
jgi:hypothetical protein